MKGSPVRVRASASRNLRKAPRLGRVRLIAGLFGLLLGILLGLSGLFLILYRGEAGSEEDVTIRFGDTEVDADIVGLVLVVAAVAVSLVAIRALRRRPS